MKVLFLTQYFPPETGAPQNRLFDLAKRLRNKDVDVSVLTAMPNYPKMEIFGNYKGKFYLYEEVEGLKIYRAYIFVRISKSLLIRLLNYFSFVFSSLLIGILKIKKQDYIFCESPPLFLGISALLLSKLKKAKLIFNVSDLWPESAEKLGLVKNRFLLDISTKLEELIYKNSYIICGQTNGIINNIKSRFPGKTTFWLKNGADINICETTSNTSTWREKNQFKVDDFLILYAGIFGYAQGLEVILHTAGILKENIKIKFILIGDGPEKEKLIKLNEEMGLTNVYFFNSVPKNEIQKIIPSINAAVIPLKKIDLFKGAIPSKIFEVLSFKKPILLGVEGEAKELFIDEGKAGLNFIPDDSVDLAEKINILVQNPDLTNKYGLNGYNFVKEKFNRKKIAQDFYNLIFK